MNVASIRSELVDVITTAVAPVEVFDEDPDIIVDLAIVVAWAGSTREPEMWRHQFEVRIIFPPLAPAEFAATRDAVVDRVATALDALELGSSRRAARPTCTPGVATVGDVELRAVVVTTNVTEPPTCTH